MALWSDDPSTSDLLSFDALAATAVDALLDARLDPVALGLSGRWGSGKSTVLALIEHELEARQDSKKKILVVKTQPWRYDPTLGAKETLIGEVLGALTVEVESLQTKSDDAKKLLKRLAGRIEWAKAIKVAAKAGIAFQIPSIDDLVDLVKPKADAEDQGSRSLEDFRTEFEALTTSDDFKHIRAVVVLVDDLDRCLPRTVVESLEAIRLFLAVPKMSFVIAADEERVQMPSALSSQVKVTRKALRMWKSLRSSIYTRSCRRRYHYRLLVDSTLSRTFFYCSFRCGFHPRIWML